MKVIIFILGCFLCIQHSFAQYTQVPDPNFEQALIDLGIDSEGILDGQFLTADAENIAYLYVDNRNITDLTGIEAFVNIEWLDASNNNISAFDLSIISSTIIWTLNLGNNNLSSIDLSQIPSIVNIGLHYNNFEYINASNLQHSYVLTISYNPLINIDISNSIFQVLELNNTPLTYIDLSTNTNLRVIELQESQIQTLDFSNNPNLEEVYASNSPLTSINLPNNPNLEISDIDNCQLTELDVTNCTSLWFLNCSYNTLNNLDLSGNLLLEDLNCSNNQLTSINLSQNINLTDIIIKNNNLESINLSGVINLIDIDADNNPLSIGITGIENCTYLEDIDFSETMIGEIDLSQNPNLKIVDFFQCSNVTFVNLKNGYNSDLVLFVGTQCPQLSCVVVDDPLANNDNIAVDENTTLVGSVEECDELSINKNELQNLIQVYPNPVKNILYIEKNKNIEIEKITVFDILGKTVLIENNSFNKLNLSDLYSGILFIKIETEKGIITKKIIKE